jgi:hypothetical protein
MIRTAQPEYTALDLIHWDVCLSLRKLNEQLRAGIYQRLLISSDRPFLNVAAATTYLETVPIANPARLRDLVNKMKTIIDLHNEEFEVLENSMSDKNAGYAFHTFGGGFLSINCEIECLVIRGKDFHTVIPGGDNYEDFALNNRFDIYSSQEFAYRCAAQLNVITAFFTEEQLQPNTVKQQPISNMQVRHLFSEIEEHYLSALYHKTKTDPGAGFNPTTIAQAIGLMPADLPALRYQLEEFGFLKTLSGTNRIALTGSGIKAAREVEKDHEVITVTMLNGHAIPMESVALYRYLYYYQLSTLPPNQFKSITVGISDFVQDYHWHLSFVPGGSAERILMLYARDKIIRDVLAGNVPNEQTIKILQHDLPNLPTYKSSDAPAFKNAEFFVYKRIRERLPAHPTHRSVPDLIIETRQAINMIFKAKHKKNLMNVMQEENISDLHKDAKSKEEFNTRIASLGSTAGEMNVDLLRTITGETDTEIRSIQLLKKLLVPLDPAVEVHIKTLQNITTVRNGYPAHKDKPDTLKAYDALGLTFPVSDYSAAWQALLLRYLTALQGINQVIKQKYA